MAFGFVKKAAKKATGTAGGGFKFVKKQAFSFPGQVRKPFRGAPSPSLKKVFKVATLPARGYREVTKTLKRAKPRRRY